jgi:FAD/FMN-containing dehydrogenase
VSAERALERLSWGRFPRQRAAAVQALHWRDERLPAGAPLLPRGCGSSYGDSCLNEGGVLVDTTRLDRLIAFDRDAGIVRCEAGMTLERLLEVLVPAGWFLPVTPGTRRVTIGGAIANDVHGKNHHRAGTFGAHVRRFELLRSDGSRTECSPQAQPARFGATVGGLGLTGLVTWAEFGLRRIASAELDVETLRFHGVDEFLALSAESHDRFEHTVAWIDATSRGSAFARGLFMRANHVEETGPLIARARERRLSVPFDFPSFALSRWPVRAFNAVHFRMARLGRSRAHLEPFFYPLDAIGAWNRMYGRRGFVQHQSVVPMRVARDAVTALLDAITRSGEASFLSVLKVFGDRPSPGMLAFARPGVTLALDFPMRGERTLGLLERLDAIVMEAGGAIYPAKDARMSAATFRRSFPRLEEFRAHVDPAFSSSFWRRVHG